MHWLSAILFALLPAVCNAQGVASLVADSVRIEDRARLIATGNVEVFYDGQRLSAGQIIFDQDADRLEIFGPLVIQAADGTLLAADRASLDPKLENGLLRGARLVLDQQLQLAANQIDRVNGRYSQLYKTAVTSCQVCGSQAPLWSIRAERVIHDDVERQLYFENATFMIRDVPVLWIPKARLPDPTLTRATGFLIPSIRTTNQLSTGIKTPYFIALGDHRDLTLTPYISTETRTLEARYRQAFLNGDIEVNAAVSRDSLSDGGIRAYLFAEGQFELPNGFNLSFDVENSADPAYLLDYGFSEKDRLDSALIISRARQLDLFAASLTYYETLRDDETNNTLPPVVADLSYESRSAGVAGGILTWEFDADAVARTQSDTDLGRDVLRVGTGLQWQRRSETSLGLVASTTIGAKADYFRVNDDPNFDSYSSRFAPSLNLELAFPLLKETQAARHLLEPVAILSWRGVFGSNAPNEDSTRPELDHGNLLWSHRLPGEDAIEEGFGAAAALSWTRRATNGTYSRLTFGRVLQDTVSPAFNEGSGLDSRASDWLVAGQFSFPQGPRFEGRTLLDRSFDPTLATAELYWQTSQLGLEAQYIWQRADADLSTSTISEWSFDTVYKVSDAWSIQLDTRYDVAADQPARAGLGIGWRNECITVDLSVSRRFTSSTTVDPSTDFGLSVSLGGFSAGRSVAGPVAQCNNE